MNAAERKSLMDDVRNKIRPKELVLSEDDIIGVKLKLMNYAIAGNRDEVGSLAHTAFSACDTIGFLQFDLIDALNEIQRLRKEREGLCS